MIRQPRPTTFAVLLSLATGVLVLLVLLLWLLQGYRAAVATTAAIEPRYARILGVAEAAPELAATHARVRRQLAAVAYGPELDDSTIGTGIQQRVRRHASQAGLEVAGSQIQPARALEGFTEIGVQVTVQGSLAGLQAFLAGAQEESPRLQVASLSLAPQQVRRAGPGAPQPRTITATLQISGHRVNP